MLEKILIIDDEFYIGKLLKTYLEKNSFKVDINCSGRSGLIEALNKNYDLIILDFMLPEMDGYQILKKLRRYKSTPVMMLSTQDDKEVANFFLQSGANDFVVKPFICKDVVDQVKKIIGNESRGIQNWRNQYELIK